MATHKMTKSNRQIDVNNAFSKAVEKKSSSHVTWDNDIEQPTNQQSKKTQIRVNVASRKKVVFRDDGTIVETLDNEEQDTSSQELATPCATASTRSRTCAATRGNRGRPRPTMTIARGRGRGHTPGSHYFGAGGQGGCNFRAPAPDGRTHLIQKSVRNAPPQQTVSEQYVPGVSILPVTQQALLNRRMAATNLTMSYVARSRHQLPTDNTSNSQQNWLNIANIPNHTGVREDGTFEGLDGNANSRALVPYDVQPDPIAGQQAIVVAAPRELAVENSANTLAVRRTSYGLRTSASNYARRMIEEDPTREVFFQEDGTMYGPGIDKVDNDKATTAHQGTPQCVGSTVHQDDPQDTRLERGAIANLNRGARNVTMLIATDPLLESTDPQHQPGSMTVHHRAPGPKQGLVDDPQDDGQARGEQVGPQQIPASNSDTGTSMCKARSRFPRFHPTGNPLLLFCRMSLRS